MIKTLLTSTLLASSLLLIGCGGESTDEISKKDKVAIAHDVGVTGCLLLEAYGKDKLKDQEYVENVGYSSKDNDVSCSKYGKTRTDIGSYENIDANIPECVEFTLAQVQEAFPEEDLAQFENKDKSCVLAFDLK